jgi:bleomycin hydrolase
LQLKNALESDLPKVKQNLLVSLLRFLSIKIGVPPKEFSFNLELCGKPAIMFENVSANDFYSLSGGKSRHKIIQFGSDPALEYYKTYTYSNHKCLTEGTGFTFINIPIQEMNEIAVRSITKNGRIGK